MTNKKNLDKIMIEYFKSFRDDDFEQGKEKKIEINREYKHLESMNQYTTQSMKNKMKNLRNKSLKCL